MDPVDVYLRLAPAGRLVVTREIERPVNLYEADRPRTRELQHDRIDPREMVRQQQEPSAWQSLRAVRRDAVNAACEGVTNASHEALSGRESGSFVHGEVK